MLMTTDNWYLRRLLQGYAKMSGTKKVRIALQLSKLARQIRQEGALATNTSYGLKPR